MYACVMLGCAKRAKLRGSLYTLLSCASAFVRFSSALYLAAIKGGTHPQANIAVMLGVGLLLFLILKAQTKGQSLNTPMLLVVF